MLEGAVAPAEVTPEPGTLWGRVPSTPPAPAEASQNGQVQVSTLPLPPWGFCGVCSTPPLPYGAGAGAAGPWVPEVLRAVRGAAGLRGRGFPHNYRLAAGGWQISLPNFFLLSLWGHRALTVAPSSGPGPPARLKPSTRLARGSVQVWPTSLGTRGLLLLLLPCPSQVAGRAAGEAETCGYLVPRGWEPGRRPQRIASLVAHRLPSLLPAAPLPRRWRAAWTAP